MFTRDLLANNSRRLRFALVALVFNYCIVVYYLDKHIFDFVCMGKDWATIMYRDYGKAQSDRRYMYDHEIGKDAEKRDKLIIMWHPPFANTDMDPRSCPGCWVTYDRHLVEKADSIIFHCAETWDSTWRMPLKERPPHQRWVWWCMEPPWNTRFVFRKTLTPLNGIFNWTMSYRRDSDIYSPYSVYWDPTNSTVEELIARKNASAVGAWVVSNCAVSKRRQLIDQLSRHIPIDVFGSCSKRPICRPPCFHQTLSRYRFYFALENSNCKDYITEKFWHNALYSRAVPVVMGTTRADYEKVAPPDSFIHVDDFATVDALAAHLRRLADDDKLYARYLRWTSLPASAGRNYKTELIAGVSARDGAAFAESVRNGFYTGICGLCEKLKRDRDNASVVERLDTWWYGEGFTSSADKFGVCSPESGPSGRPLGLLVTAVYSLVYFVAVTAGICCCGRR